MKLGITLLPVAAVVAMIGFGCQPAAKKPTTTPSALDVRPAAPKATTPTNNTATYAPPAVTYTPPARQDTSTPRFTEPVIATNGGGAATEAPAAPSTGSKSYVVKKGDTLIKIARDHYGNASKWKQIAAANPGSEASIKAGQKLVIP